MFDRKESKKIAKQKFKKHYVVYVIACLLISFIGIDYTSSMSTIKSYENEITLTDVDGNLVEEADDALSALLSKSLGDSEDVVNKIDSDNKKQDYKIGLVSIGYRRGVFANIANSLSTGSIVVVIYKGIVESLHASDTFGKIVVVLASLLFAFIISVVKGGSNITFRRLFLEGYTYDEVKAPRYLFLIRCRKWFKAFWVCFVQEFYQLLWSLTIVGGIIKHYSYSQTHYITAENPDITPSQAITLSREMMKGHKWEKFTHDLTFLGWELLTILTLGLSGIFFSNPYREAYEVEYFVYLRSLAIENKLPGYEILNDKYLYEKAPVDLLKKAYPDIDRLKDVDGKLPELKGIKGFLAKNFGIVLSYNKESDDYNKALSKMDAHEYYMDIFNQEDYPARLAPIPDYKNYSIGDSLSPNRQYSVTSLIMMFFIFAFVGWSWEVLLHIVEDGVFVNRGVLHGPWLPIYGAGVVVILIVLYRARKSLPLHFVSAVVVCGVVEYFTSYYLELTKGIKWWDYTGYFLNINGRVCAEGLLVFGLGGTAAAYVLAPVIDAKIRKIKPKVLYTICTILVLVFTVDAIYSKAHPNTGKGITDYKDERIPVKEIKAYVETDERLL